MQRIKRFIAALTPHFVFDIYHYLLAWCGAILYKFPSRKLIVIGVTGTKGKTSTANFIWSVLQNAGYKTGIITTANIRIGTEERENSSHMTMPGRFFIHKILREMVDSGCVFAVVETTSQGISQFRHKGILYDIAVFTNLSPEHIESHGSYENYRKAKGKLFASLNRGFRKKLLGQEIDTKIIYNADDKEAPFYSAFTADKKISYALKADSMVHAKNIVEEKDGVTFVVGSTTFKSPILGAFNVYNILPAIAIAHEFGIADAAIEKGLTRLSVIPGRMEHIELGQNFMVVVDYAHEQSSMRSLLTAARALVGLNQKIILLFGSEGGGRDKAKRSQMGAVAGELADIVVVSDTDPYDDEPFTIVEEIAQTVRKYNKKDNETLFLIPDRRTGIKKALQLANNGDIVLFACMGAQKTMIRKGGVAYPWDERAIVTEELENYLREVSQK